MWSQKFIRILAIDDEVHILDIVRQALENAGFIVSTAVSGTEALTLIERHGIPHLILVDLQMPVMDGFEFCRTIREFSDLPIIILTGVSNQKAIVEGLDHYADDYILKPFIAEELVARVKRALRRVQNYNYTIQAETYIDQRLTINFYKKEIHINNEYVISLTPTETKILHILVQNAGRTVSPAFFLSRIWPMETATDDRLHVHIHRLREKLDASDSPPYIISERGIGYKFGAVDN